MNELRVVLLGYGLAGAVFHAPLIAVTPGLRLTAVVTSDPERADAVRRAFPDATRHAHADEVWRDASRYDLAVVATPNRSHAPLAHAALEAGLAVLVDKPLAVSVAEAEALHAHAQRTGRTLAVFQNRRWDNDYLTLRRLLSENALGEVRRFESRFERWRPAPRAGWRRSGAAGDGGGVLMDLGAHLIDQALQLFGPVHGVHAELRARHADSVVDDDSFVALEHAGGVISHLWMSSVAADAGPRLRVLGSEAAYLKYGLDPQEDALRDGASPIAPGWGTEPESAAGWRVQGERRERVPSERGDYPGFYRALHATLRDGTAPPVGAQDAIATLRVIEAARQAAGKER
jgi:scyllo-inositol 2-dehydrogenase (NADP+)